MKFFVIVFVLVVCSGSAWGQTTTREDTGRLAASTLPNPTHTGFQKKKIKPGSSCCNKDEVCVTATEDSGGNATIDPKDGNKGSETTVDTKTNFEGEISGLDANDTVHLGSSNEVSISGVGGTVNVSGGSTVTVSNVSVRGTIRVNLPSGGHLTVHPDSDVTLNT